MRETEGTDCLGQPVGIVADGLPFCYHIKERTMEREKQYLIVLIISAICHMLDTGFGSIYRKIAVCGI